MPLERREVESALQRKGFRKSDGDHSFFIFFDRHGKKTSVRTKTSHGSSHKSLGDGLISAMARQCHLNSGEFRQLVECTLSHDAYENILKEKGLTSSPGVI